MKKLVIALAGSAFLLGGCATQTETKTLVGGLGGAGVGAIAGSLIGHSTGATLAGAAIGAAAGAVGGKILGDSQERKELKAENEQLRADIAAEKQKKKK